MKTKILTSKQIKIASQLIRKGELVVFPTETVYGIGANAYDSEAVKKIFVAKGRPSDNPLIVHISSKKQLFEIAKVPKKKINLLNKLIEKFWPGPLTVILEKKQIIPNIVTANLDTVAVRMPKNKVALNLIKYSNVPICAPSANISTKPSGTCFEHVFDDFNGKVSAIIKSKSSDIGIESTVIDLTSKTPLILRPGGVSYEELKKIIPNISFPKKKTNKPKSPGMKYKHYAPNAKVFLFEKNLKNSNKIVSYENKLKKQNIKFVKLEPEKIKDFHKKMYKLFRDADKKGIEIILISAVKEEGVGLALMNRLRKSAYKIIK